jgi:hypothetical protein
VSGWQHNPAKSPFSKSSALCQFGAAFYVKAAVEACLFRDQLLGWLKAIIAFHCGGLGDW